MIGVGGLAAMRYAIGVAMACLTIAHAASIQAQDDTPESQPETIEAKQAEIEAAIAKQVTAYTTAFNDGDLEKLISLWSPEGVYINRSSSEIVQGRPALLDQMKALHESEPKPTMELVTESVQLISPSVALERGTAIISRGEESVSQSRYQVVFVNVSGEWLIDRVTEEEYVAPVTNYEQLQPLEWLIGEWVDEDGETRIEVTCEWTKNQNFISRRFSVHQNDEVISSGLEIIGWDPLAEHIRSWLFDSDGTYVEGVWSSRENEWVVQSMATMIDGARGSFTSIYEPQEDGNFTFKKTNQIVDGAIMPNTDQVLVIRRQ